MIPHPVDVHVGKRLRLRRTMLGLSQESLGDAVGITFQQVQKYERGVNRMGSSRLYEFGAFLRVPISFFFEGFEHGDSQAVGGQSQIFALAEEGSPEFLHEDITTRETLEVMRSYNRISDPSLRKRMADLIRSLADKEPAEAV